MSLNMPTEVYLPPTPVTIVPDLEFDPAKAQHARLEGVSVIDTLT